MSFAYVALTIYGSLHPFSGWRDPGLPLFFFLDAAWPRYWTPFDLLVNVLVYLPLGFLLRLSLRRLPGRWTPVLAAFVLGGLLSLSMETLQAFLPTRVASNLDLACNTLGAGFGALLAHWQGERFFTLLASLQRAVLAPIAHVEFGLTLIALWLLTQLSPETLLFGAGDLRHLLRITPALGYAAPAFFALETAIIVCNTVALGLLVRTLLAGSASSYVLIPAFFALALAVRTLGAAILLSPSAAFVWLTPGAALGLLVGGTALFLLLLFPATFRLIVAALALMAGGILVNIAPPNPYSVAALAVWRQGQFLNFNGLTRLTASLWPFLALPYLMVMLGRRE